MKRFLKFKNLFSAYPAFSLELNDNLPRLLRIKVFTNSPSSNRQEVASAKRFLIELRPSLFQPEAPENTEEKIFSFVISKARELLGQKSPRPESRIPSSDAALYSLWKELQEIHFPERQDLTAYRVLWSLRPQNRCLASCNIYRKIVRVSHAMSLEQSQPYLEALLYHEMCHAVLGEPKLKNGRRILHGREFKALERKHPGISALDQWIEQGGWSQAVRTVWHERSQNAHARPRKTGSQIRRRRRKLLL